MLSIEKCKKILNAGEKTYTDDEILKIREFLYQLAEIDYLQFQEMNKDEHLLKLTGIGDIHRIILE